MKKKYKIILGLGCIALGCIGLAACSSGDSNKLTELDRNGNIISVTFNPNGGKLTNREGVTVVDKFNPDNYQDIDGDGCIEISLKDKDPVLSASIGTPTKIGYTFAGWYRTRELLTDENGAPVDDYGNVLEAGANGLFYIKGTKTIATQGYSYSDIWDFENDTILYELGSGSYSLTLYAAWVPYYKYEYYYQEAGSDEWTLLGNTTFDYSYTESFKNYAYTTAAPGKTYDAESIWVPTWSDENNTGNMVYTYKYSDGENSFTFPHVSGMTFSAAYSNEACTENDLISGEFKHAGTLNYDTATATLEVDNLVQKIYVEFVDGEQYRIATAEQFANFANINSASVYTILSDLLDFSNVTWPSALTTGDFAGTIIGNGCTFTNISAKNNADKSDYGGLFGALAETAVLKDITFTNVTYDMNEGSAKPIVEGTGYVYFGVFAGYIESAATVQNVSIENATLRIGKLSRNEYKIGLICGNGYDISYNGIQVELYSDSKNSANQYLYYVSITVNTETKEVFPTIVFTASRAEARDEESYIAYFE